MQVTFSRVTFAYLDLDYITNCLTDDCKIRPHSVCTSELIVKIEAGASGQRLFILQAAGVGEGPHVWKGGSGKVDLIGKLFLLVHWDSTTNEGK